MRSTNSSARSAGSDRLRHGRTRHQGLERHLQLPRDRRRAPEHRAVPHACGHVGAQAWAHGGARNERPALCAASTQAHCPPARLRCHCLHRAPLREDQLHRQLQTGAPRALASWYYLFRCISIDGLAQPQPCKVAVAPILCSSCAAHAAACASERSTRFSS